MYLENLVFDAVDPQRLGRFWEAVVGGETLTDEPAGYETRLVVAGGPARAQAGSGSDRLMISFMISVVPA